MKYVGNCYIDKLELLPNEFELAVTTTWCYSVISILERMESYEELISMINTCIYSDENKHASTGHVSKYVMISVGNIKKIINICGAETLCYILPYNYEQISNEFLCNKLGDIKIQIDSLMDLEAYDDVFNLINNIVNERLKHLALIYMKSVYMMQTENMISTFVNSRKRMVNRINSVIKESQY